jgi:hypothetical protein
MCKIPSFGEHRGDLRSISGSDSPDFSNLLIDQVAYVLGREPDDFDEWGRQVARSSECWRGWQHSRRQDGG